MNKFEIYPDYKGAHKLLLSINSYKKSLDEFVKQGRILQDLLYRGTTKGNWGVDEIINSFYTEYLILNNNEIAIDWYIQCFFIWQRLKGEYDKRQKRTGAIRTPKIYRLEEEIYKSFINGINDSNINFVRSDQMPSKQIPSTAVKCHDFFWWIEN